MNNNHRHEIRKLFHSMKCSLAFLFPLSSVYYYPITFFSITFPPPHLHYIWFSSFPFFPVILPFSTLFPPLFPCLFSSSLSVSFILLSFRVFYPPLFRCPSSSSLSLSFILLSFLTFYPPLFPCLSSSSLSVSFFLLSFLTSPPSLCFIIRFFLLQVMFRSMANMIAFAELFNTKRREARQSGTHGLPYERTNIMWADILRIHSKLSEVRQ